MKEPKPFYKKSHACWYVSLSGKQVRLAPDKEKAWAEYHKVMAGTRDVTPDTTIIELIAEFLAWSKAKQAPGTYEWYKGHIESWYKHVGNMKVGDVKPYHVERWITARYPNTSNGSTIHGAMRCVGRVFSWAKRSGRLAKNPLEGMAKPTPTSRDVYLTPDQYKAVIKATKDEAFREYLEALRQTGCRPQEARTVEARHFDRESRCWVFPKEESKGRREPRVILLNDRVFEIVQRLALKHPEGPLFRNRNGVAWTKDALNSRCHRLQKRLGFHVCCYAVRHTFATDAIIRGVDLVTIASLMGHKSLDMLHRIYQHVQKRSDHLREGLRRATEDESAA